MSEAEPLLRARPPSPTLSSSLPLTNPYLPTSQPTTHPSYGTSHTPPSSTPPHIAPPPPNPYYRALSSLSTPPSPNPSRRPLDRIHHLPPPHLNHASSMPSPVPSPTSLPPPLPPSLSSSTSSPHVRRLSTFLSITPPLPPPPPSPPKRVEVVSDRLGKPQVREEREWPKPKKDAQYDDDALFDYHSLLVVSVLLVGSVVLYEGFRDVVVLGNAAYVWSTFLLSLFVVWHAAHVVEMLLLKLLSLASGSRVWKVYFYSQALHETLGNVLTILYALWCRYYCHYIAFPVEVKQYLDPTLHFALLMFLAVIIRQVVTKHLTYIVNQERYAKAVQDLLFKGHVLARLCDQYAYQPLYSRPPPLPPADGADVPYTPLLSRRKYPLLLSAASSSTSSGQSHPLYDVFMRLRDFNESLNDDYLPGGTGVSFFSSEKVAKAKAKELFRNVDRDRKGYLDIHDFRAFFPKETALRAFKLFFTPKDFKVSATGKATGKKAAKQNSVAPPPLPFRLGDAAPGAEGGGGGAGAAGAEGGGAKKKGGAKKGKAIKEKGTGLAKEKERAKEKVVGKIQEEAQREKAKEEIKEEEKEAPSEPTVPELVVRKPSATILSTLVAENKEAAVSVSDTPSSSSSSSSSSSLGLTSAGLLPPPVTGDFSSVSSSSMGAVLAPIAAASDLTVGEVLIDAQSAQEKHLQTLHLTYSALESRILGFHESRQTLSRQLRDLDGLADVMQSLSQLLFWVIVGLMLVVVFDEHLQSVMFSLSTILLSFTFVFATTIKDIFQAMILIFATKPYSVGDRVNIGKDKYRVHSIQLLTTTFRDLQNKLSMVPNNKLASASIQNLTRSSNVVVKMKIAVAFDTPSSKLGALRQRVVDHVQALPMEWKPSVSMHLVDLQPQLNTVNVSLLLSHLASYTQVKEWKRSKTELLHVIREEMIALGIAWKNPESTVSLVSPENLSTLMEGVGSVVSKWQGTGGGLGLKEGGAEGGAKLLEGETAEKGEGAAAVSQAGKDVATPTTTTTTSATEEGAEGEAATKIKSPSAVKESSKKKAAKTPS